MIRSKLIDLLKTFSASEFSEFGKFINSPLHNDSKLMIKLYDHLKKQYPDFSSSRFTKENIYQKLYGAGKYEDKKFRERFSDMHKLAEDYISWVEYKSEPITFNRHSLRQYFKRNLEVDFNKKYKEIQTILDNITQKDDIHYYLQYCQLFDKREFYETKRMTGKRKPQYENLKDEIDQFTMFFMNKMLIFFILMQNRQLRMKFDFEYKLYRPVMEFLSEIDLDPYPAIKSCYLVLRIIEDNDNEEMYYELKEYVTANSEFLDLSYKKMFYPELYNYVLIRIYKEKQGWNREGFDILMLMLKHETYPTEFEGYMEYTYYLAFVQRAIAMGRLNLTEEFIKDHTGKLNPLKKENMCAFVKGLLHYARKNYSKAVEDLSGIKDGDFALHIRSKALLAKIYFDQNDYEGVLMLIDAFKHYLNANPMIPEYMNKKYTNFMNILRRLTLLSLSLEKDEYSISKLINEINSYSIEELTSNKSWLLERAGRILDFRS